VIVPARAGSGPPDGPSPGPSDLADTVDDLASTDKPGGVTDVDLAATDADLAATYEGGRRHRRRPCHYRRGPAKPARAGMRDPEIRPGDKPALAESACAGVRRWPEGREDIRSTRARLMSCAVLMPSHAGDARPQSRSLASSTRLCPPRPVRRDQVAGKTFR
jgi:hypothetical protein